jgi:hypothetical protein
MRDTPERDLAVAEELGHMADARIAELERERDALIDQVMQMRRLYGSIFKIKGTGDLKHPLKGEIDYDAKAAFESVLFEALGETK